MSSRPDIHIQASFLTLHYDIFLFDIILSLFPTSQITTCDIHSLSFLSSLLTRHYPRFHLEWWFFTRHYMEDCHILSPRSPHEQWFRDFSLRGCLVSEDSCYICMWRGFDHLGMYFHGSSFPYAYLDGSSWAKHIDMYMVPCTPYSPHSSGCHSNSISNTGGSYRGG